MISRSLTLSVLLGSLTLAFSGCQPTVSTPTSSTGAASTGAASGDNMKSIAEEEPVMSVTEDKAEIERALSKLSAEDRALAVVQGYCPLSAEPLGSMGTPVKLILKDQPVFLCCKGCESHAQDDPDETRAKVDAQKKRVQDAKPKS